MVGTEFAGYLVERKLGAGGMGAVYLARHPRLPRRDALKVLSGQHTDAAGFRASFLREAEVAARLRHPNLVAVRDRGESEGRLWIAMQYVEGGDLAEVIRLGRLRGNVERAVHILGEAAQGLDELHRAGLLHRDVKPANILIAEEDGRADQVLVTDFGIARRVEDWTTLNAGGFTGTLAYAAPEQLETSRIDHRADVYALGCTLFQMLTGSVPFPRDSVGALMYAHLHEPPPSPSSVNAAVPTSFDAVVAKAMAKSPEDRYDSCGDLATAARAALAGVAPTVPARAAGLPRVSRFGKRRRIGFLAALAVVAIAAGTAVGVVTNGHDQRADGPTAGTKVPTPPVTGTIEPAEWGKFAYIAEAFPDLLPATPNGAGYQALTGCMPMSEESHYDVLSFDAEVPVATLYCVGDNDPVYGMFVVCNADRSPISPDFSAVRSEGSERWSRKSGSGTVHWGFGTPTAGAPSGDSVISDRPLGTLDLYFDDAARNFCRIQLYGNTSSGAELRARWWPDAPL
ncbi:serine/threonine-protein kinase [Nocardia sp. JMUB6875]|uniref:serine/threonine-protein kinase n=1 Tax=Nocardia sp. JMUB6875 TaxID=3158170 RepID=UPI0034E8C2EF